MLKDLTSFIKDFDVFGQPVKLYIKQNQQHKTFCGSVFSFGLLSIIFYLAMAQIIEMVSYTNPIVIESQNTQEYPEQQILGANNFSIIIGVSDPILRQPYHNDAIFQITMNSFYLTKKLLANGTAQNIWKINKIPLIRCSFEALTIRELDDDLRNFDVPSYMCIDFQKVQEMDLLSGFDSDEFHFLRIDITACNNSSDKNVTNQGQCAPQGVIDNALNRAIVSYCVNDRDINLLNPSNPNQISLKNRYTTISKHMMKDVICYLQQVITEIDQGIIAKSVSYFKNLRIGSFFENIDLSESDILFSLTFRLEKGRKGYYVSYLKLMDIIGNIGGVWSVLYFMAGFLVLPVVQLQQQSLLVNSFFQFERTHKRARQISVDSKISKVFPEKLKPKLQKQTYFSINLLEVQLKGIVFRVGSNIKEVINHLSVKNLLLKIKQFRVLLTKLKIIINQLRKNQFQSHRIIYHIYLVAAGLNLIQIMFSKNASKIQQLEFAQSRLQQSLDVIYLIRKLNEIDKLKMLLLSTPQIQLFDYMNEPTIPLNPNQAYKNMSNQYWSILKEEKKDKIENIYEAFIAFQKLKESKDDQINLKLLMMVDQEIVKLFQEKEDESSLNEQNNPI